MVIYKIKSSLLFFLSSALICYNLKPKSCFAKKPLTKKERREWKEKGFTDFEIDLLYNDGTIVDAAGNTIRGSSRNQL